MAKFYSEIVTTRSFEIGRWIDGKSVEMKARRTAFDREIAQFARKFDPSKAGIPFIEGFKEAFFWHIGTVDASAAYPAWLAYYDLAMERVASGTDPKYQTEQDAIEFADYGVRTSQAVTYTKDLSAVQRGSELNKLVTMFYSYFSLFQNKMNQIASMRKLGQIGRLQAMRIYWWWWIAPALFGGLMQERKIADWGNALFNIISYRLAGLPFVRDMSGALAVGINKAFDADLPVYNPRLTPAATALELPERLAKALVADKDQGLRIAKAVSDIAGYSTGYWPSAQFNTTIDGIAALMDGESDNPIDIFMRNPDRRK